MSLTTSEQCLSLLVWSHWSSCSVQAAPLQEELQYLTSPHRMQHSPSPPSTRTQHQSQTRALIMSGHYLTYQEVEMKIDVPYVYSTVTKRQEILDLYFYILIVRCHFLEKDYWISDPILKIKVYKTTCARAKKQEPCPWTRD